MPEENSWRKARDKDTGIGGIMGQNTNFSDTDTLPIPLLDVERKTVPVFCLWYQIILGLSKTDVAL